MSPWALQEHSGSGTPLLDPGHGHGRETYWLIGVQALEFAETPSLGWALQGDFGVGHYILGTPGMNEE